MCKCRLFLASKLWCTMNNCLLFPFYINIVLDPVYFQSYLISPDPCCFSLCKCDPHSKYFHYFKCDPIPCLSNLYTYHPHCLSCTVPSCLTSTSKLYVTNEDCVKFYVTLKMTSSARLAGSLWQNNTNQYWYEQYLLSVSLGEMGQPDLMSLGPAWHTEDWLRNLDIHVTGRGPEPVTDHNHVTTATGPGGYSHDRTLTWASQWS